MNGVKFPLTISIAGHAVCLALLIAIMSHQAPPPLEPIARGGVEVLFAPPPPPETPPPPAETPSPPAEIPPPPEPQAEVVPPPPEPPPVTEPPPPPVAVVEPKPPPPPPKPVMKKPLKPVVHRVEPVPPPTPASPAPALPSAPPQTASTATPVPAPAPSPEAARGYGAIVSAWLNSHKQYPESARQRGEEGHAQLHFEVDPSGRVIDYAILKSSGYPDLDAAIEAMMRGATLPPFPAGMNQTRFPVTVTITFRLER